MSLRRGTGFALAAIAVHGLAITSLAVAPSSPPANVPAAPLADEALAEIDLDETTPKEERAREDERDDPSAGAMAAKQAASPAKPAAMRAEEPARESAWWATPSGTRDTEPFATEPSGDGSRSTAPRVSGDALGIGDRNVFVGASPNALVAAAPDMPKHETGGQAAIRAGLHEHDVALGLGGDGPVIAALEDVARTSSAAVDSKAVFEITADAEGRVTSVRLVEASSDWSGWQSAGEGTRAALAAKRLRVPHGARGIAMTIAVESKWTLPSGNAPASDISVLGLPVKKSGVKNAIKTDILKPVVKVIPPKGTAVDPPLSHAEETNGMIQKGESTEPGDINNFVPLPGRVEIGFTLFGSSADPTDAAPRPLRVVHAHVLRENEI